jgi:hypothetical protein
MVIVYIYKPVGAAPWRQCFAKAGGSTMFCTIWYILLYLDRLLVVLIEGELLCRDSSITVAGFDVIPLQALKILSTPCCFHIGCVGTLVGIFLQEIGMEINSAFNENLCTWESIDTDRRDGNCSYIQAGRGCATEAVHCKGRRQYHVLYCMVHIVVSR